MANEQGKLNERSGSIPGRSSVPGVQIFENQTAIDADLDKIARTAKFRRSERWENFRQFLTISFFSGGFLAIVIAFAYAAYVLVTQSGIDRVEFAKWILETIAGGLVAGLIGFWAVKSFEK